MSNPNQAGPEDAEELEDLEDLRYDDVIDPSAFPAAQHAGQLSEEETALLHPLARLFTALWRERDHGGVVEIHLEGIMFVPDWWAEALSSETHGVFALQNADGSYVIEAVPWDSIRRITVRRITELPDGVFH